MLNPLFIYPQVLILKYFGESNIYHSYKGLTYDF